MQISALRRTLEKKAAKESGNPASPSNAEEKAGPSAENEAMTTMGHFNTVAVHGAGKTKDALGAVTMPIYQVTGLESQHRKCSTSLSATKRDRSSLTSVTPCCADEHFPL